jgi:hypothetical protein
MPSGNVPFKTVENILLDATYSANTIGYDKTVVVTEGHVSHEMYTTQQLSSLFRRNVELVATAP